ncbi:DNA repair protein RAD50 isoform X2 [Nematostella vectensis]|uniref:DNA repair protein RAD50 isoform X2 n=1 Tax=Nematostella vectensis TaxID=45351 RepID=UPI0020774FBA|nr:DNA repair protein RAD50 isoform X2 [Nematostella vectensis]
MQLLLGLPVDGVIMREVHGQRQSISSKCAEINREMISFLGVSKAVLETVIFCHQEESNWPLSEGKVLKQKFDEIFSATRYIKALDAIQKLKKEQMGVVTECETELKYLKENKDKAQEIAEELERTQGKVVSTRDTISNLQRKLQPIEERISELAQVSDEVHDLEKRAESLSAHKRQLLKVAVDLQDKITHPFSGSTEELQEIFDEFRNKIQEKDRQLLQSTNQLENIQGELLKLSDSKSRVLLDHGKLEQQAQRQEDTIKQRDQMVADLAAQYGLSGYDQQPMGEKQAEKFMSDLKQKFQEEYDDTKRQKQLFDERIKAVQKKIDDMKKSQAMCEETIRLKKKQMRDNQQKLRQIGQELSNVDASANRLKTLDAELQRTERELKELREQGNIDEMNAEIDRLQAEKRQIDSELRKLQEEQQAMHHQSSTQAKLDMLTKEKSAKMDAIQKIRDQHEHDIQATLGGVRGGEALSDRLSQYLGGKKRELQQMRTSMQKMKQEMSAKDANKKMIMEQIRRKEEQCMVFKDQLKEACGDRNYNTVKEELQESVSFLRDEKGISASIEKIYQKYIKKLTDPSVKNDGCPLCHRRFEANAQIKALVDELKTKMRDLPAKTANNERLLVEEQRRFDRLLELGPSRDNLERLQSQEIPETKSKLTKLTEDIERISEQVIELEDACSLTESEEQSAREMQPDIRDLDAHNQRLQQLDRDISLTQSKLHGIAPGRTMQAVTNEYNDRQDRVETLNRHIDRRRREVTQLQRQLSTLENTINELRSQKLRLSEQLQRRTNLEEQKAELIANNNTYEREITDAEAQLKPIESELREEEKKKAEIVNSKESMEEASHKKLTDIKNNGEKVQDKSAEIKRYISQGGNEALRDNERKIQELEAKAESVNSDRETLSSRIDKLKNDISKQEVRARELEDNLQLKSTQEEICNVERQIGEVQKQLRQYGNHGDVTREKAGLQTQLDDLRKERAHHEGRQKGFEEEIRRFQKDLRSEMYGNAEEKHRQKVIDMKTTKMASGDLEKYYKALNRAIMKYHSIKMAEINKIIKEYWINTYKGNDIDTIEIRSEDEDGSGASKARRTYNYRVVMIKGDLALDMRGRCSAGQKVLASLIIRLALAETFCLNCGILTLDEPTTNLDEENIESLANQLANVIRTRQAQRNFQLIVITHDENFVELLGRADFVDFYYRISKNDNGHSKITKQSVASLHREESYIE